MQHERTSARYVYMVMVLQTLLIPPNDRTAGRQVIVEEKYLMLMLKFIEIIFVNNFTFILKIIYSLTNL